MLKKAILLLLYASFANTIQRLKKWNHEFVPHREAARDVTVKSAVAQLDDEGRPIQFIPTDMEGRWEYPETQRNGKVDMSVPKYHVLPNGQRDAVHHGIPFVSKTFSSLPGQDDGQIHRTSSSTTHDEETFPSGSALEDVSSARIRHKGSSPHQMSSEKNIDLTSMSSIEPIYEQYGGTITKKSAAGSEAFSTQPEAVHHFGMVRPTVHHVLQESTSPWELPSTSQKESGNFQLKDLLTLFSLNLPFKNFRFPDFGGYNNKFSKLFLTPSLPEMNMITKYFRSTIEDTSKKNGSQKSVLCIPYYNSSSCPMDWNKQGRFCVASEKYVGPCAHIMDFSDYHEDELASFADECKVDWPCKTKPSKCAAGINYAASCPDSWLASAKGCQPGSLYSGRCREPFYMMEQFTENDKKNFELLCDVSWPCNLTECQPDYSAVCPLNYTLNSNMRRCVALESNTTDCSLTPENVSEWTLIGKQEWSRRCHAKWPCLVDKINSQSLEVCERNYSSPCPRNWGNILETGLCEVPTSFHQMLPLGIGCEAELQPQKGYLSGLCRDFLSKMFSNQSYLNDHYIAFDYWRSDEKQLFSRLCSIVWPCVGEDMSSQPVISQYFHGCPVGFRVKRSGTKQILCESVSGRKNGTCDSTRDFSQMTVNEISTLSRLCGYQWNANQSTWTEMLKGTDVMYLSD